MRLSQFAWSFALLFCLSGVSVAAEPVAPAKAKTSSKSPADKKAIESGKPLFNGKDLDGWKIPNFGTQGEIEVQKDETVVLGFGDGATGITWTKDFPKTNYEVTLEAKRIDGTDFFCGMTFPVGDSPCSFIVGGWGGMVCGLSSIDGQDAANNETTKGKDFKKGQWYKVRVKVTPEKIECWIDDEQMVDQKLAGHKISIRPEVDLSKPFGIASWQTTAGLRNLRVREIGPQKGTVRLDASRQ
ncbi:MAG: DUF1080 domain-containing protein [Planctomycetota bacterium]|nr:DUF1080 domain-containing protein [Planctomycetota bacterium]